MGRFFCKWLFVFAVVGGVAAAEQYWHLGPGSAVNAKPAIEQLRHPSAENTQAVRLGEAAKSYLWFCGPLLAIFTVLFAFDLARTLRARA